MQGAFAAKRIDEIRMHLIESGDIKQFYKNQRMKSLIMSNVKIRKPLLSDAGQLAEMLSDDTGLRADLSFADNKKVTADEFMGQIKDWCAKNNAVTFAIVAGNKTVGTISLSHRSPDGTSAKIGYWIGTEYRRKGYCSKAFRKVLQFAANEDIKTVSGTVAADNIPSRRLWEHYGCGSKLHSNGKKLIYELNIENLAIK